MQYLDKFMDMCVCKIMPAEEKSQRRAFEHSGNKSKEVLFILSESALLRWTETLQRADVHQQRHRGQTVLRRRVLSRTMLPIVRAARGTQESELMEVIATLQRVIINSVVETLIAVIDVAVFASVDRERRCRAE